MQNSYVGEDKIFCINFNIRFPKTELSLLTHYSLKHRIKRLTNGKKRGGKGKQNGLEVRIALKFSTTKLDAKSKGRREITINLEFYT